MPPKSWPSRPSSIKMGSVAIRLVGEYVAERFAAPAIQH